MTPENPAFVKLSESVEQIRSALLGNDMEGRKGIIHFHDLMREDLYGLGSDGKAIEGKKNTLLLRVSDLEDGRKKAKWLFGGALVAALAAKFGISALLEKYFK